MKSYEDRAFAGSDLRLAAVTVVIGFLLGCGGQQEVTRARAERDQASAAMLEAPAVLTIAEF